MSKELDELRQEYAENEAKLRQYQNRVKRLEQRRQYYEKGERQKRAHRLITRGPPWRAWPRRSGPCRSRASMPLPSISSPCQRCGPLSMPPPSGRASKWPCSI